MVLRKGSARYNPAMDTKLKMLRKSVGERIRNERKSAGLTQEGLGEKAELSYKYIGELERGQVNASLDTLYRIATALGTTIDKLILKGTTPKSKMLQKKYNLPKLTPKDIASIKRSLKNWNRIFSKI